MVTSDHWAGCDRIVAAGPHAVDLVPDRKCAVPSYYQRAGHRRGPFAQGLHHLRGEGWAPVSEHFQQSQTVILEEAHVHRLHQGGLEVRHHGY